MQIALNRKPLPVLTFITSRGKFLVEFLGSLIQTGDIRLQYI
jgi:hypothetical protein